MKKDPYRIDPIADHNVEPAENKTCEVREIGYARLGTEDLIE